MLLSQNAQVLEVAEGQLRLGFASAGARDRFGSSGGPEDLVASIVEVIGVELRIAAVLADEGATQPSAPQRQQPASQRRSPEPPPADESPQRPVRQAAPAAPAPPLREPAPEFDEVSQDDDELDAANNAEELLTAAFDAEVISVEELGGPASGR